MSKHMKRLTTPVNIPVPRKENVWITKPSPGPHPVQKSAALATILRDMLKVCDTAREARRIIGQRKVLVDGRPATDLVVRLEDEAGNTATGRPEHVVVHFHGTPPPGSGALAEALRKAGLS